MIVMNSEHQKVIHCLKALLFQDITRQNFFPYVGENKILSQLSVVIVTAAK